ncbi:MAG TPA: hypothetical protein VEH04_01935 [Verrucomicrobiae bacterium]|nr:hypothetical protein [Verrucomicrobiae bacterium]
MKITNCIKIGFAASALLVFAGCVSNSEPGLTSNSFAVRTATLGIGGNNCGGFNGTSGSTACVGPYTGFAIITNSASGTIWFTAPAGATNCVVTDSSGFASPYVSVVKAVRRSNLMSWCGTNSVSFPANAGQQYKFTIFLKSTPPPPTNGQPLVLEVDWNP